jgi:hypothetical protein
MEDFCQKKTATKVWDCLVDAQNDGGHGYALPLEMTIYVLGSESGRHRSVVVCEWAAAQLRKLLRENEHDVLQQPLSVGTQHREVAASRQKSPIRKNRRSKSPTNLQESGERVFCKNSRLLFFYFFFYIISTGKQVVSWIAVCLFIYYSKYSR